MLLMLIWGRKIFKSKRQVIDQNEEMSTSQEEMTQLMDSDLLQVEEEV